MCNAEIEVPCPILSCGKIILQYSVVPASNPGCDWSPTRGPAGPPLEPGHPAYLEFEGAYDPRTLEEVDVSKSWERWLLRAAESLLRQQARQ